MDPSMMNAPSQAYNAAALRIHTERLALIEKLSNELKSMIAEACDPDTAIQLALTGPIFYDLIKRREIPIAANILYGKIGRDLMNLAAALYSIENVDWCRASTKETIAQRSNRIRAITNTFLKPPTGEINSEKMCINLKEAAKFIHFHSAATYYTRKLTSDALMNGPGSKRYLESRTLPPSIAQVSAEEFHRVMRAIYIWQLACNVLSGHSGQGKEDKVRSASLDFWTQFLPWEHQQARCIRLMLLYRLVNPPDTDNTCSCGHLQLWPHALRRSSRVGNLR
ncbi:hypothetical protein GGR54DRAFT_647906 [Hypoxylon sp. NC1633]|nr:hypothetical protein GGR54DRAFT_647906 [Hypoxylon sp. NC1633]